MKQESLDRLKQTFGSEFPSDLSLVDHPSSVPGWWTENGNRLFAAASALLPSIGTHGPVARNSTIVIGRTFAAPHVTLWGSDCLVYIGHNCSFPSSSIVCGDDSAVLIGEHCRCTGGAVIDARNGGQIFVAGDNLWSAGARVITDDMHAVRDASTGKRLNPFGGTVHIQKHVWIGMDVIVRGSVRIGGDVIIGARSVVTRDIPPNCIAAGTPARVIRTGITWSEADEP